MPGDTRPRSALVGDGPRMDPSKSAYVPAGDLRRVLMVVAKAGIGCPSIERAASSMAMACWRSGGARSHVVARLPGTSVGASAFDWVSAGARSYAESCERASHDS